MAFNPSGAVAVPLTVFGSWVTEVPPESVPENISPDNQDIVYRPGGVGSRPCADALLANPFPVGGPDNTTPTVVNQFSFVLPIGAIQNLYFDSNGVLWVENFSSTPGIYSQLAQSIPGSFCRFMSSFGRCYIAISDGLHGADIPYQYDGTNLLRFTNDAPGAAPAVNSITFPPVSAATGGGRTDTIASITTSGLSGGNYTSVTVVFSAPDPLLLAYQTFTVSGNTNSNFNSVRFGITYVSPDFSFIQCAFYSATALSGTGGTATFTGASLSRQNNVVTAYTSAAHNLRIGYQALLQGNGTLAIGGGVASITINNEQNPGRALVTTNSAHGLLPDNDVAITGVTPATVGSAWSAAWNGSVTTMTSGTAHNLVPGAVVVVAGGSGAGAVFNTTVTVALVPSPTVISFAAAYIGTPPLTASGLTVSISWPVPDDTPTPTYFEVDECPTPTSFFVQVTYTDGVWASGNVTFSWDGTFFVQTVPSPTSFTYLQYGPPGSTTETAGTITPWGQCAPGLHLVAVCFQNTQGDITAPSPFATFESDGGQYPSIINIPIGPATTVARILVFTGAQPNVPGELPPFFYIPEIPQIEGQIVGTSTVINDNTATAALLDFSDTTLYAALGISIPGNNLANQFVLDGALGFGAYTSRLTTWGQRNTVDNLLGMHFGGGTYPFQSVPLGWTIPSNSVHGTYAPGYWAGAWNVSASSADTNGTSGLLQQSAYVDCYGKPILTGNTSYSVRFQVATIVGVQSNLVFFFFMTSASTGYSNVESINASNLTTWEAGNLGYLEVNLGQKTPIAIPPDMIFGFYAQSLSGVVSFATSEWSLFFTQTPYLDQLAFGSYVNNPAGMDGDSGEFGANDPSKLMDMSILRDTLYLLTQAPTGRLHETNGSAVSEPNGWQVDEVAANCGTLSAFGLTHSQADDTAASGGDDWMAWPSEGGVFIFGGGVPEKISQEIQPNWYDPSQANTSLQINMAAAATIWAINDPVDRLLMIGLPIGSATAPNQIYVLNYRNLGSAQAIAGSPPFHPSFSGKLIATDNSRKWTHWNLPMNNAARMYRSVGELTLTLAGGNGQAPGLAPGYGNAYSLNPALKTDEDYGQVFPFYVTYAFLDPEKAQALQLKGGRILMAYLMAYIQGTGQVTMTYYPESLNNMWRLATTRTLNNTFFDREFGGANCTGNRIFVKIASSPITGTDNSFTLTRLTAFVKNAKLLIGGRNQ